LVVVKIRLLRDRFPDKYPTWEKVVRIVGVDLETLKGGVRTLALPEEIRDKIAANFHEAFMDEFWTSKLETRPEHIRHIPLKDDFNNNKMERMNGEIRDREKVMRGLERKDSPILTGYQLFHNYIRPHKALDYRTPSEVAGIEIKGKDKWLTIIQNAKWHSKSAIP
jgi:hypothetical protein